MSVFGFLLLKKWGSQSSDIPGVSSMENPLPPCPDSPNCIRTTKQIDHPVNSVLVASSQAIKFMGPIEMTVSEKIYKIEAVFRVILFKDDMVLKLTKRNTSSTYLHIRSASRVGKNDFGVNSRRVKKFLQHLLDHI
jgi:uncharacterized protein (DUF1499 family)